MKRGSHKQINFSSLKNYFIDGYEEAVLEINFSEYENFDNVDDAYSNFIQNLWRSLKNYHLSKIKESKGVLKNGLIMRFQKN